MSFFQQDFRVFGDDPEMLEFLKKRDVFNRVYCAQKGGLKGWRLTRSPSKKSSRSEVSLGGRIPRNRIRMKWRKYATLSYVP
jgi:hypothetical protein